jgi:ankyrin repeat protein
VIHAAIYRRDANALKKVIATQPQSVNKESYYGEEPYWLFGYVLPLSLATKREWHEGVAILLANGADAGKSETGGWTPMTRAISQRDFESVRLFLENGASPRQRAIKRDGSLGPSPLDDAVSTRDVDYGIFQILVKYGAVPDEDLSVESKIRLRELNWLNK